jgi:hypothetical protein
MREYINMTTFNMRIDRDILKFLKMQAIHLDCSMTDLANKLFSDYKVKIEKKRKEDIIRGDSLKD